MASSRRKGSTFIIPNGKRQLLVPWACCNQHSNRSWCGARVAHGALSANADVTEPLVPGAGHGCAGATWVAA